VRGMTREEKERERERRDREMREERRARNDHVSPPPSLFSLRTLLTELAQERRRRRYQGETDCVR
jgi:hypothetical protein